ncbi:MAG: acyltransferase [Cyanobacteria bacterium J06623_7]
MKSAIITKQLNIPSRQRVEWVDYAKGIAIFLMVLGHTLRGLISSSIIQDSFLTQLVDRWIYGFHIPLFFLLSGLFFGRARTQAPAIWLTKKLKTMVYPYFLWTIMQIALKTGFSGAVNHDADTSLLREIIYDPIDQFWFIYTLFLVSLFFYLASRLGMTAKQLLIVAIALYLAHVVRLNFGGWGMLYLFRRHAIYFALGSVIGSKAIAPRLSSINTSGLIVAAALLLLSVGGLTVMGVQNYLLAVPLIALLGIAGVICLSLALERLNWGAWLKNWGNLTLQIYLAHTIASAVLRTVLQKLGIDVPLAHLVLGTAVGIYVPLWLNLACRRVGFKYLFTWP